jgi:hypothetical protein
MTNSIAGYKISKTKIDKENIGPKLLEGYVKNVNGQLISTDENGNESQIQIDVGDLQLENVPFWKTYTINPAVNNANPYSFVNPEQIHKANNKYSIRVLLNGIELDSDEIAVAANNTSVTLTLLNDLTIDSTDELKIWYIKA